MSEREIVTEAGEARALIQALMEGQPSKLDSVARSVGMSKWSLWGLLRERRKVVGYSTLTKLRNAYLRHVERQIARLEAELDLLRAKRCGDASLTSLGDAVARLVDRVKEARERAG